MMNIQITEAGFFFLKKKKNPNSNTIENTIHYLTSKNSLTLLHIFFFNIVEVFSCGWQNLLDLAMLGIVMKVNEGYEDEQKQKDKKEQLKS